jgi:hypothetical protein
MNWHVTAEEIERANRVMRNPFESDDVRLFVYGEPVASDDGLFTHRGEYVQCFACQHHPAIPESPEPHLHLVIEGANGGVRCEPLAITPMAQDCLSRWGADAFDLLIKNRQLFLEYDG